MSMLKNLFVFRQNFSAENNVGNQWLMIVQEGAAIILLIAAVGAFRQYHLFNPAKDGEPKSCDFGYGLKFIRAAYVWFIVAMAMLVLVPVYNLLVYQPLTGARIPFSHAFFGAYRHALTVGFITMMIVGVSSKVAATFSGLETQQANSLWATFLLLNLGNAARILTQIATDFTPAAYPLTGMTGFIELFGLTLWGYELVRNMYVRTHLERETIPFYPEFP